MGFSIEEARDAEGKRRSQKREGRIFDMVPEYTLTFQELTDWYLSRPSVQALRSSERVQDCLNNFNSAFGDVVVSQIKPVDIEDYQHKRLGHGAAPATVDMEISIAKTMATKAYDNDMAGDSTYRTFRKVKRLLKKDTNARDRILTFEEYRALLQHAADHLRAILVIGFNTGMRRGEILGLKWSNIDRDHWFVRLPADDVKERKPKSIPINRHVKNVLGDLDRVRSLQHEHVITYRGHPIAMGLRKSLVAACKAAGIPYGMKTPGGLRFHDIRTTVKTNMLRAGVDKALRDMILGHSLQGMDAYYLKPTDDDLRQAMDKYTAWIDAQLQFLDQSIDQGN
ncbi:MAG: site-specific integrase [Planctomycetota bacterium]